jgi:flavoprotein
MTGQSKRSIYLEDRVISQMLNDPRILQLIPSLNGIRATIEKLNSSTCSMCQATKKREHVNAIRLAKQYVLGASKDAQSRVKSLMRVDEIRVVEKPAAGKPLVRVI